MAALGCSTATTQAGQLCATTKCNVRAAGFQAIAQQAVNDRSGDRSQVCSVSEMGVRAAMAGEGRLRAYRYNSTWKRGNSTIMSGRMPSFGSDQPRGLWGNFLQIFSPPTNAIFNNSGEDVRVEDRTKEQQKWLNREAEPAKPESKAVEAEVVELKKEAQHANVAQKAVGEGSAVATSALDKVGDVLRTTGLEINLDVGLKELTIKELVLKDLGLVLAVKTKPRPEAEPPAAAAEGGNNSASPQAEGGNNTAA